jgi:hypothetical protein
MLWRKVFKLVGRMGKGLARSDARPMGGKSGGKAGSKHFPNKPPKLPGIWLGGPTESRKMVDKAPDI